MAATLEEQNNKNYLHKNKSFFPMEKNSKLFSFSSMAATNTLYMLNGAGWLLCQVMKHQGTEYSKQ